MHARARPRSLLLATALVVALAGCSRRDAHAPATPSPIAQGASPAKATTNATTTAVARKQLLEITASYDLVLPGRAEAEGVVAPLVAFANERGGFAEEVAIDDPGAQGGGRLVLRIPPSALGELRERLARGGAIAHESLAAKDVTDAIADVDARRASAAAEETRLLKLLDEKTGSLADVLAVEKALSDVRERIERLDAEARVAKGRVDLATVTISLHPSLAAPNEPAFTQRVAEAARDGVSTARDVVVGLLLLGLRAAPTLAVLGILPALIFALARRRGLALAKK